MISIKSLSLEAQLDGQARPEHELVIIAKLEDKTKLKSLGLDVESQEQYSIRKPNGEIRVRKVPNGYQLTTKTWQPGVPGKLEAECECSKDQFDAFKLIADNGMIKDRYHYPLMQFKGVWDALRGDAPYQGALILEIDVFKRLDGSEAPYVKIDLEFPKTLGITSEQFRALLPDLGFTEVLSKQWNERTEEEARLATEIFNNHFLVTP